MKAGDRPTPLRQNLPERVRGYLFGYEGVRQEGDPQSGDGASPRRPGVVRRDRGRRADFRFDFAGAESPRQVCARSRTPDRDALVPEEVVGSRERRRPLEIRRRRDEDQLVVGRQAAGDHVLLEQAAAPDRGVEPPRHQVDQPIVDGDLEPQAGMSRAEFRQNRRQQELHRHQRRAEARPAGHGLDQRRHRALGAPKAIEGGLRLSQQRLARFREGDAARGPGEEPRAKARLQPADRPAHARRRHPEASRRLREPALLRDGHKRIELENVACAHLMISSQQ